MSPHFLYHLFCVSCLKLRWFLWDLRCVCEASCESAGDDAEHSTGLTQFFDLFGSFLGQNPPQVDNLTAGCVKAGLKVVRIGRPEATRFDLEKYNLLEMVKAWRVDSPWIPADFLDGHTTIGIWSGQQKDSAQVWWDDHDQNSCSDPWYLCGRCC